MAEHDQQPRDTLLRMVNGYQVSQAIHVATVLRIADRLKGGPRQSAELAEETGTHAGSLYRLLRALASIGVFREEPDRRFALTALGELLCTDAPDSVTPWVTFIGRSHHWQSWEQLSESVRTGQNAARLAHGMDVWEYRSLHREEGAIFDAAMTANWWPQVTAVLAAVDLGRFPCVVDVGGGQGMLLGAILAKHPETRGVLFDQPQVVAGACPILTAIGVADRCRVVGGNFFESVPDDGDAYILKQVLHDWKDEEAVAILRVCRQAMGSADRLIVIERVIDSVAPRAEAAFFDLLMLVGPDGRERTAEEYADLFARAGFRMDRVTPTTRAVSVIEGCPV